ncbi:FAD-dependent oxidoreductase [Sutcliffiella sp. NPDC057660]|uniref:FAD-dependent oxidoreductase n=1 Tax=Sutcliffiella sp. NPDC057660 TaxID=3346199 RepID=UPI003674F83A
MKELNVEIPKFSKSLWREYPPLSSFQPLRDNIITDVTIVGAGITGITTAYLLAKEGIKVVLVDAGKVIAGTTGYTTAKISSQHGLIYNELIRTVGEGVAKQYYNANQNALSFIRKTSKELNIDCELTSQNAYVYASSSTTEKEIEKEAEAYERLGLNGGYAASVDVDLPFEWKSAIVIRDQAQFHPVIYLQGMLAEFLRLGGKVFEQTRAEEIEKEKQPLVKTTDGHQIKSKHVIVSSHFPFNDFDGLYFSRLHVERSYAIAVSVRSEIPDGMYLSADKPSRSLRYSLSPDGEKLLLLGGEGHPVGQSKQETLQNYEKLADFGDRYFGGIIDIPYRWSSQDIFTLDKVPYIGQMRSGNNNVLVATGYAKWGMTNGTAAALVLKDLILHQANPYKELFDPSRSEWKPASIKSFVKENANVAKELVKGKAKRQDRLLEDLGPDEGALVKVDGKKVGAYKDTAGHCHLVHPTCTHMGCDVEWNNAERSWDCPCHASRFNYKGEVIEGPAVKDLSKFEGA